MRAFWAAVSGALLTLAASRPGGLFAAETGDFDGDGRLSIADVRYLHEGRDPAPGSMDAFGEHPCADRWEASPTFLGGITYLEALRRGVTGSLPHFFRIWDPAAAAAPLAQIDLTDAIVLLQHLFLGGLPPPPPGTERCGEDPTADQLGCPRGC